ncbi:MAG: hypothetical protein AABY93_03445 [Bacteroidota bacterium]
MTTTTYAHNRVTNPVEELLVNFTYVVISVFRYIERLPTIVMWAVGLFLLITFGLIFTIVFYLPMLWARHSTKNQMNSLIASIDKMSERDAMELHAAVEPLRLRLEDILRNGTSFYVFKPIMNELRKTSYEFLKAEEALFNKAYPNANVPLTKEQERELVTVFKSWKEDWEDEKMNVYN